MRMIDIDQRICTGCRECAGVCPAGAIAGEHRQPQTIDTSRCIMCGQCVQKCKSYVSLVSHEPDLYEQVRYDRSLPATVREPLFAAYNICHLNELTDALADPEKVVIVQSAPAVRVAIAEEFGYPFGTLTPGKLAAALHKAGFDYVYDTCFGADLTVMEEAAELVDRIKKGENLPLFTSCCPAWVTFLERNYPEFTNHLSTCKSPMQMFGAIAKTYGAKINKLKAKQIYSVAVMPCTCKEFEASRQEMNASGCRDVDTVITVRELAWLLKNLEIDFESLPDDAAFDQPFGTYSGAGDIFGATGGVAEAAIRVAYEMYTGKPVPRVDIYDIRGTDGLRTSQLKVGDMEWKVGVVCGLDHIAGLLESLEHGELDLHFVEVMACPAGCVSGGGMPKLLEDPDYVYAYHYRRESIFSHDRNMQIRKSDDNPSIQKLYKEYLKKPGGELPHKLLHTTYTKGIAQTTESGESHGDI